MVTVRALGPGDEAITEAFLSTRPLTTMYLRSNFGRGGFGQRGTRYEGTYAGAFDGELVAVGAHYRRGNVVVSAGEHASALLTHLIGLARQAVKSLYGSRAEVAAMRTTLAALRASAGEAPATIRNESTGTVYALELDRLVVPHGLENGKLETRTPRRADMEKLLEWRMAFCAATMNLIDTPEARAEQRRVLDSFHERGDDVLVIVNGIPVSYSAFNAILPDTVQVGGVWTPPEHRARGYARAAVAASLLAARLRGVVRAILYTDERNAPANAAYTALGFRPASDYGLISFE